MTQEELQKNNEYLKECEIVPLQMEDFEQINVMGLNAFGLKWTGGIDGDSIEDFIKGGFSFVAKRKNKIEGVLLAYKCPAYGGTYDIFVEALMINDGAQGKGLGKKMLYHLKREAIKQYILGIKLITKKSLPAYNIYKHIGFTDNEKDEFTYMIWY